MEKLSTIIHNITEKLLIIFFNNLPQYLKNSILKKEFSFDKQKIL